VTIRGHWIFWNGHVTSTVLRW